MLTRSEVGVPWRLLFVCLATLLVFSVAQAQTTITQKFVANGAYAELHGWNDAYNFELYIQRGGTTTEPQTSFYFYITEIYWTHGTWITGGGTIDNSAFKGDGTSALQLLLDTTNKPELGQQRCDYDFIAGTGTCEEWAGGLIDLQWKRTPMFEEDTIGKTRRTSWPYIWQQTGRSFTTSAKVTGSFMGFSIATDGWLSRIGSNQSLTIERQRMGWPPPRPAQP